MENEYMALPAIRNIMERKSVRSYDSRTVEEEKIDAILRAGMAAPSGKNVQPWELVVVSDRARLEAMAEALPYAKMLKDASVAIVVAADTRKSPYWYVDCSAVTENILLAAEALGLGAVWTATYPYRERMDVVKKECGFPQGIDSLCVIPLGYPARDYKPREKYDPEKIHREVF